MAALEVGVGLRVRDVRHRPADPDLPAQALPVKHKGCLGILGEFAALHRAGVGVEDEASGVEALEQHHAHVGQSVGVGGGQRHGVGIVRLGGFRLAQPGREQRERFIAQREVAPIVRDRITER